MSSWELSFMNDFKKKIKVPDIDENRILERSNYGLVTKNRDLKEVRKSLERSNYKLVKKLETIEGKTIGREPGE